ncbi:MAG: uL30 family ribosomal protein [Candidatus Woesearchaeota archaeon]|jgi:large subunit ribosomal protein L30
MAANTTHPVKEVKPKVAKAATNEKKLALVKIRGMVDSPQQVRDTFALFKLFRKNHAAVVPDTPTYRGMINKIKDYATWGEINEETFQELVSKRGEEFKGRTGDSKNKYTYKFLEIKGKKYKTYFRLSPPRKGFERKGTKAGFQAGGALGYRGDKINDLIKRML